MLVGLDGRLAVARQALGELVHRRVVAQRVAAVVHPALGRARIVRELLRVREVPRRVHDELLAARWRRR